VAAEDVGPNSFEGMFEDQSGPEIGESEQNLPAFIAGQVQAILGTGEGQLVGSDAPDNAGQEQLPGIDSPSAPEGGDAPDDSADRADPPPAKRVCRRSTRRNPGQQ
jgi:hypothetical protein